MKPKISMRGQALTAGELEDKKKTNQDLFTAFIMQYNKILQLYSCHAFTFIDNFMDASVFEVCPPDAWEKAQKKFGELMANYEALFNKWRRSGYHGDFKEMMDDAIANLGENTNPAMLYLHEYLSQSENYKFFDTCMGFLSSDTFSESTSGPPRRQSRGHPSRGGGGGGGRYKARGGGGGGGQKKDRVSAEENAVFESMSAKNNIISLKSCSELSSTAIRELQNQHDRKRTLTTELANHIGSAGATQDAKERIAAYRLLKRSDDSDGDDDNPYVDSQESLIVSIVDFESFISYYESQLKSSLRDLSNKK
jgi:hypothetical protein